MPHFDLWKLSSEYSIVHAALIIAGHSPEETERLNECDFARQLPGYLPAKTALYNAVRSGVVDAIDLVVDSHGFEDAPSVDIYRTLISVHELRDWLRRRGVVCDLFERPALPEAVEDPSADARYPAKLYAANAAWRAVVSEPSRLAGRSPKQALETWLTENALSLGLINKEGQPNRTGIEEICKVANWKPEGGATPTPSNERASAPALVRLPSPAMQSKKISPFSLADLDDEIPF